MFGYHLFIICDEYRWFYQGKKYPQTYLISRELFIVVNIFVMLFFLIAGFCIPQRVILSIMCFLAIAIAYAMRVCLSVAITEMVARQPHVDSGKNHSICTAEPLIPGTPSTPVRLDLICIWIFFLEIKSLIGPYFFFCRLVKEATITGVKSNKDGTEHDEIQKDMNFL